LSFAFGVCLPTHVFLCFWVFANRCRAPVFRGGVDSILIRNQEYLKRSTSWVLQVFQPCMRTSLVNPESVARLLYPKFLTFFVSSNYIVTMMRFFGV
jgi:hypothetical protein